MKRKIINAPYRWAGSKKKLLIELIGTFKNADTYIEPFLGSGVVLLNTINNNKYKRYYANDINPNIINFYNNLKKNYKQLEINIKNHVDFYNNITDDKREEYYYNCRNQYNNCINNDSIETSALFWFLMKAGFNGVYRINNSGKFNVPFGKKKKIVYNNEDMRNISVLIKNVTFLNLDYKDFIDKIVEKEESAFIYIDPPYIGESNGAIYHKKTFSHEELIGYIDKLKKQYYAISMEKDLESETVFDTLDIENYNIKSVTRTINPSKLLKKDEYLYTNYSIYENIDDLK